MPNNFIQIVYLIMFLFVLFLSYKIISTRTKLPKVQDKFKQKLNPMVVVLNLLLFVMIFTVEGIFLKFMIISIILYFLYANTEPIILTDMGIYYGGRLDGWEDIKQWAYDDKKKFLVIVLKINGRDQQRLLPVDPKEKDRIMKAIRTYKKK